jgi:type I restriction enzyme M protein
MITYENMKKTLNSKALLSIGEVSSIFGIHQDTLRNWEKKGLITPLRVGPRGDRKYRPEDIERIANDKSIVKGLGVSTVDDSGKMNLAQLKQFLWRSADILRGKIDSSDYKKYIFGLLFYKRISDSWDEEYKKVLEEYHDEEIAKADHNHRFQVPKDCRWEVVQKQAEGIGHKLNDIFDKLTNANSPKLDKIFDDLDFANKDKFPNETIQRLVNHFSQYNFGDNYISSDLLGDAYEYLIEQFAADAGKKGGEFYTPREVERVIINILKPHEKDHIYDMAVGSGGFLLEAYHHLKNEAGEKKARSLYLYGQEINIGTYAIAKINMFLHGLDSADIQRGDTLADPKFLNPDGSLKTFDICVANPPYSISEWEYEMFKHDKYGRVAGYEMPPVKKADYAFVLHMVKSMNENGRAGIVLPHGVLFRGGAEGRIREELIKNDLIEAVIALPAKLFYGTGIPAAIVIFNKNKPENHKNKILIIDAEQDYEEGKNQNRLRKKDIEKMVSAFEGYRDIEKYARVVDIKELRENEFNINVRRYVENGEDEEVVDVKTVWAEVREIEKDREAIDKKVANYLSELKY